MKVKTTVKAGLFGGNNTFQQAGVLNIGFGNQAS